jgi:hypothetical protein
MSVTARSTTAPRSLDREIDLMARLNVQAIANRFRDHPLLGKL